MHIGSTNNFIIDLTIDNLQEVLELTKEQPCIFNFTSKSNPELSKYSQVLTELTTEYKGQFLLVNIDCEVNPELAMQFRIQSIPTLYLFKDGAPVDAVMDIVSTEELREKIKLILPKEEEVKYRQALEHLNHDDFENALPLLKESWELTNKKNSDVGLLYAETYIELKKIEPAKEILQQIPIQDRDSRWQGLQAQIELLIKSADTPEIQELQQQLQKNPNNLKLILDLAIKLNQANRNEESLSLLFNILKQDMNADNGKIKQQFLDIISAIGNADPISNKYRKMLYTLMY